MIRRSIERMADILVITAVSRESMRTSPTNSAEIGTWEISIESAKTDLVTYTIRCKSVIPRDIEQRTFRKCGVEPETGNGRTSAVIGESGQPIRFFTDFQFRKTRFPVSLWLVVSLHLQQSSTACVSPLSGFLHLLKPAVSREKRTHCNVMKAGRWQKSAKELVIHTNGMPKRLVICAELWQISCVQLEHTHDSARRAWLAVLDSQGPAVFYR